MDDRIQLLERIAEHAKWLADPSTGKRLDVRKEKVAHDFTACDLTRSIIAHCDLTGSRFGRCCGVNFAFSVNGDFAAADLAECVFYGSTFDGKTLTGDNPIKPVPEIDLNNKTKDYLKSVKYLTCQKRGDPTAVEINCGCNVDRVIYSCEIHGKCLKRLPSHRTAESFGSVLVDVTMCSECGGM